jgi:hypothetical protein
VIHFEQIDQSFSVDGQRHRWNEKAAVVRPDPALPVTQLTM